MNKTTMNTKHIEHWEDLIITGDLSVLDFFNGDYEVSLKLDGSPAVFWGFDPNNGKFFVALKSIFNKFKKKICYSVEDIEFYYQNQPKLIAILTACFNHLPKENGIFSGDFLGFGGTDTFQPNTITYKFSEVITQKIVIAPHTLWETQGELKNAYVSGTVPFFVDTDDVKFIQPCVDLVRLSMPQLNTNGVKFLTDKQSVEAKKKINALIREGEEMTWWNLIEILGDKKLAHLYLTMIEIKDDLMNSMIVTDSPVAFINGEQIVGEGFVLKNDKMVVKLVNRPVFAFNNFTLQKNWG